MPMTTPRLVVLGPLRWFLKFASRGKASIGVRANGYGAYFEEPPTVYVRVFRFLLGWERYRAYLQRVLAHEWQHIDAKSAAHEPAGDMMSHSVWSVPEYDRFNVMTRSAEWRERVSPQIFGLQVVS